MIKNILINEKTRLLWLLAVMVLIGTITGRYLLSSLIVLIGYIIWLLWHITQLNEWIKQANFNQIPPHSELFNEVIIQIVHLKKQNTKNKKQQQKIVARFNEILRTFPDSTIVINANNEITWVSKNAAKTLGLHRKKDIGLRINNIIRHAEFHLMLEDFGYNEFLLHLAGVQKVLTMTISPLHKDTRILSIRTSSGHKLDQLNPTFISNAFYELSTPLAITDDYLKKLSLDKSLATKSQKMITQAKEQTQKISLLIADLLLLFKLENTVINESHQQKIYLAEIVTKVLVQLKKQQVITQNINNNMDANLSFLGTKTQWQYVVQNLLENAIRYSTKSGQINISWQCTDQYAVLCIADSGDGTIDDAQLKQLFVPFYHPPQHTAQNQGTGLGLTIIAMIVKQHNGELSLTKSDQQGLQVAIKLPIKNSK